MPIVIKDETAGAVILTIDNNGNLAFGDGTPINMLTLGGYGVIDSQGYVVHGLGNAAVIPVSGSINCPVGQTVTVYTIPGIVPMAVVDTTYPTNRYWIQYPEPGGFEPPPDKGEFMEEPINLPTHSCNPLEGHFDIYNNAMVLDQSILNPNSPNYQLQLQTSMVRYRYI